MMNPNRAAAPQVAEPLIGTHDAAHALCDRIEAGMDELLAVIEQETALVRAGKLIAAGELQPRKAELVADYVRDMQRVKSNQTAIGKLAGDRVERLRNRHGEFRALLQINMAVLATAREVAEDLVRSVATTVGAQARPQTYAPPGAAPRAPVGNPVTARGIAVDRNL